MDVFTNSIHRSFYPHVIGDNQTSPSNQEVKTQS